MDDYKEIITQLLLKDFSPILLPNSESVLKFTTAKILSMFGGIIPTGAVDEHEMFTILKENHFTKTLKTIYHKDKDGNDTKEVSGYVYLWNLYKKE